MTRPISAFCAAVAAEQIEANSYGQRTINFTNRSGWHQSFASMQNNLPFRYAQDYQTYINRLKQYAVRQ